MVATKTALTFVASASQAANGSTTGTGVDLRTALEAGLTMLITNGSAPTIGCDGIVEISTDNSTWREWAHVTAPVTASTPYYFPVSLPDWAMYARVRFTGNTGQAVTVEALGSCIASIQ